MLNEMFIEIASMPDLDEDSLNKAKELFKEYKDKKILIRCEFEDEKWTITDEYSITGLNFRFQEFLYKRYYEALFDMDLDSFINSVKIFVTTLLGQYTPFPIRDFLNDIRKLIATDPQQIISGTKDLSLFSMNMCLNFLYMIPNERDYDLIESMEKSLVYKNSGQRALAEFDTYFLFGDIIDDFWASDLDEATRLFYYPLYIWWHITAIIPLRPREFLVTPRDCLKEKDGGYILTIRRNKLKGRRQSGVKYKIDEDYRTQDLRINNEMSYQIQKYIEATEMYEDTDIDTLLRTESHYDKWDRKKIVSSRFYTMQNLYTCLRYFYTEVIESIYHLKVVDKTAHVNRGEIGRINLGDTRHLSLFNLMIEGGSPSLAMELAGHENIEMASHYYSNLTNLIECRTYRKYRKVIGGEVKYDVIPIAYGALKNKGTILSDGNLCFSREFASGSIADCLKAPASDGMIGDCRKCSYYRNNGDSYFSSDDKYKNQIEKDCKFLSEAVDLVRQGMGYTENIGEALLRLKSSSLTYSRYLEEKNMNKGE